MVVENTSGRRWCSDPQFISSFVPFLTSFVHRKRSQLLSFFTSSSNLLTNYTLPHSLTAPFSSFSALATSKQRCICLAGRGHYSALISIWIKWDEGSDPPHQPSEERVLSMLGQGRSSQHLHGKPEGGMDGNDYHTWSSSRDPHSSSSCRPSVDLRGVNVCVDMILETSVT